MMAAVTSPEQFLSRKDIVLKLKEQLANFQSMVETFPIEKWHNSVRSQWTAGQQIEFVILCLQPLSQVLRFPKLLLSLFSRAIRPSQSYDRIVRSYKDKISEGIQIHPKYLPDDEPKDRLLMLAEWRYNQREFLEMIAQWEEDDLDKYMVTHPMLGKLTIREALYFAICHLEHSTAKLAQLL